MSTTVRRLSLRFLFATLVGDLPNVFVTRSKILKDSSMKQTWTTMQLQLSVEAAVSKIRWFETFLNNNLVVNCSLTIKIISSTGATLKAQDSTESSTQVLVPPTFMVLPAPAVAGEADEVLTPLWSELHTGISTNPSDSEVPVGDRNQEEEAVSFGSMSQTLFKLTAK